MHYTLKDKWYKYMSIYINNFLHTFHVSPPCQYEYNSLESFRNGHNNIENILGTIQCTSNGVVYCIYNVCIHEYDSLEPVQMVIIMKTLGAVKVYLI